MAKNGNNGVAKKEGFLKRKNIEFSVKRYFIDALGYMALGLFGSLIVGSILNVIGGKLGIPFLSETIWPVARQMTGPAIAVAIAYGLKAPPLVMFSSTLTGAVGGALGGPVGAFIAAVVGIEFGKAISKETPIDIVITPAVTIITGTLAGSLVGPGIAALMVGLGEMIMFATELHPIPMGILVAVMVGMILTLPISSAALCIMLQLGGIAAGAAVVGGASQMVGFAVQSYRENKGGGLVAQGLGTSMLQVPNIVRNWKIWIPPTLTSAILGPLATTVFRMENTPIGAGMGTSGFVGQFGTIDAMEAIGRADAAMYVGILLLHFVLPAVFTLIFSEYLRKINWIKPGDLKLDL